MDMDLQTIALAKVIKENPAKTARANLRPGRHSVDFTARITGSINVAPDGKRSVRTEVNYKNALATLCDRMIRSGAINGKVIDDVLRDVMQAGENEDMLGIVNQAEKDVTSEVRKVGCKGRVTTSLQVEFGSVAAEMAA
jgi:hypothetical protein